jgi:hypothetical protein
LGYVPDLQSRLPSVAVTNKNQTPIALLFNGTEVLTFESHAIFAIHPYLLASITYRVRGILIDCADMVAEVYVLEQVFPILLKGLSTVNWSYVRHLDRVIREERG